MASNAFVAEGRIVFTLEHAAGPVAHLTGYEDQQRFVVEHVFLNADAAPMALRTLIQDGFAEAMRRGYRSVVFGMPKGFKRRDRLVHLARQLGFRKYVEEDGVEYFSKCLG